MVNIRTIIIYTYHSYYNNVNDLHMASDTFKAILYADDTTLVSTVSAFKQNAGAPDCQLLSGNINIELTRINEWLALNINLNINKTNYIIFHFPRRNMARFNLELTLCGQHIECVRQFVFLGITIHETLNWDRYIDEIANKISRTLGVMTEQTKTLSSEINYQYNVQITTCTTL